jgi:hypothetical protein
MATHAADVLQLMNHLMWTAPRSGPLDGRYITLAVATGGRAA